MRIVLIFAMLLASPAMAGDFTAEELLTRWHDTAEQCRGGAGDDPDTWIACGERNVYAELLTKRDICEANSAGWECAE